MSSTIDPDDLDDSEMRRRSEETSPFATLARAIRKGGYRDESLSQGERIHHYRILGQLGMGGMGAVFEAEHIYLKQRVALKTLLSGRNQSAETAERFLREAQALAILNGPNILKVQDASVFEDIPYVVTELLQGKVLSDHLKHHGRLTINQVMDLLEQIGDVLIRQERCGILHRDIKPGNIWVRNDGSFCLIDYGLVDFTENGSSHHLRGNGDPVAGFVVGTPIYMSPEQAAGAGSIDQRADLFGLGATAWHSLTGERPREKVTSMEEILHHAREVQIPSATQLRLDVTPGFSRILDSLIAIDPDDRYATATTFMEDLESYRYGRRRPYGATRGSAFVAIPFQPSFDALFEFLQEVCGEARLAARRVDRVTDTKEIWHQIDKEIRLATVVIAIFTRKGWGAAPNPNVLTEAAHARALGRPLIVLTTDRAERLPFDWRHLPIVRYQNTRNGLERLRRELLPRIRQETRAQESD